MCRADIGEARKKNKQRAGSRGDRGLSPAQWLKTRWRRRVVPSIGLLAFLLGLWGFYDCVACIDGRLPASTRLHQAAIESLQLFVLNGPKEDQQNWQTISASWLAMVAAFALAIVLFGDRFMQFVRRELLRFRPATDLVIGGGEEAASLLRALVGTRSHDGKPRKVVAVTTAEQALEAVAAVMIVEVDSWSVTEFARLVTQRAKRVWVCTGRELRNAVMAAQLRSFIATRCSAATAPRILASASSSQPGLLDSHFPRKGADNTAHVATEFFSLPRLAARQVFRRHLPASRGETPHIALLGCSTLSRALIVHAAQHCIYHEEPAQCVRVTLFGRGAREFMARLGHEYPALCAPAGDASFEGLAPFIITAVHECDERSIALDTWRKAQRPQPFTVAISASELDADTLVAASRAAALRETTATPAVGNHAVVACRQQVLSQGGALPEEMFAEAATSDEGPWQWFDVYRECLSATERYPGERQDRRAKLIRLATTQFTRPGEAEGPDDAEKLWRDDQSDAFRWSDRLSADHIDVKLDVLARWARQHGAPNSSSLEHWRRYRSCPREEAEQLIRDIGVLLADRAIVDLLSRLEHRRFVAERLVDGWLPLPAPLLGRGVSALDIQEQRLRFRVNHTLVPYERLPKVDEIVAQRRKDELIVKMIPKILQSEIR